MRGPGLPPSFAARMQQPPHTPAVPLRTTFLAAALTLVGGTHPAHGQWAPLGQPGFSQSGASYTAMAIDGSHAPCVVYADWANLYKATAMRHTGGSWQPMGAAGFSAGSVMDLTMAYTSTGVAHVGYRDMANAQKANVLRFNGSSWEQVGPVGLSAGGARNLSLTFGPDDTPYLAYTDVAQNNHLTVKKYEGGAWVTLGTEGGSAFPAAAVSLAINSAGVPYVAYDGNSAGCRVERYVGGAWELVGSLAALYDVRVSALRIDAADVPYIAYRDVGDDFHVKVKRMESGDWVPVGTAASVDPEDPETAPGLAVDAAGNVYVSYLDNQLVNRATVKKYSNGAWQTVGNAGFTAQMTNSLSLGLGQDGVPHVSFEDPGNSYKTTVMRYADGSTGLAELDGTALALLPNPAQDVVAVQGAPAGALITVYDLTGQQVVAPQAVRSDRALVDTGGLVAGLYLVQVQVGAGRHGLRLAIER